MDNTMKKIFFILFTLVAFISYGQSVLTDVNGKVITSATGDILVQEADPNNFEYTPNAEWIPVNGVADGEIWILAFDGGTSNLFTITCTTSSGEWQMDIYGGADGKQLLRTYDTTSNVALSHTLVSGTGKYSYTSGYYTYKIVIKPKTVGNDILTIYSDNNNTPYLILNAGAKNLNTISFCYSENMLYVNTYYCYFIQNYSTSTWSYGFMYNIKLEQITMGKYMNNVYYFFGGAGYPSFYKCDAIRKITLPLELTSMRRFDLTYENSNLLNFISTVNKFNTMSINTTLINLRALTTFNQPKLRASSFILTGTSNADRSNINSIQIDWANSQFTENVDIRYNNLSATELNRIFSELPTVVVSRTIYVSSNVGSATCDPTIATAKNWIVITS